MMIDFNEHYYDFSDLNIHFEKCKKIQTLIKISQRKKQYFLCAVCANCFMSARSNGDDLVMDETGMHCLVLHQRIDESYERELFLPIVDCTHFTPRKQKDD